MWSNIDESIEGSIFYNTSTREICINEGSNGNRVLEFSKYSKIRFGDEFEISADDLGKLLKKFAESHMPQALV